MRIAKFLPAFLLVSAASVAVLITVGVYTANDLFNILAIWLAVLFFVVSALAVMRGYKRIVTRLGTANQRLAELRFLLERRYEQSRVRLDALKDLVNTTSSQNDALDSATIQSLGGSTASRRGVDIHKLSTRFKRSERRIVGRLEDELYAQDKNRKYLADLTAEVENLIEHLEKR